MSLPLTARRPAAGGWRIGDAPILKDAAYRAPCSGDATLDEGLRLPGRNATHILPPCSRRGLPVDALVLAQNEYLKSLHTECIPFEYDRTINGRSCPNDHPPGEQDRGGLRDAFGQHHKRDNRRRYDSRRKRAG